MAKTKTAVELTSRILEKLQYPTSGHIEVFDSNVHGLCLRVSAGGSRTWYLLHRVTRGGPIRRISIGRYPEVSLGDARSSARTHL
jgi:hypothetical protein